MKKRNIIDYMTLPNGCCQYCKFRKELYKEPPRECKECGFLNQRNQPYTVQIPVYEEETNNEKI